MATPVRALAPPILGDDATYYLAVNRHRRNVVADLRNPDDYARVQELIGQADAVVENFLPSQVQRLGIDRLRAANPIACGSVSPRRRPAGRLLTYRPLICWRRPAQGSWG